MHLSTGVSTQFVEHMSSLTLTTILANSAADKLMIYIYFFSSENRIWQFMQIVSIGNVKTYFWENKMKYFKILSAENFTQLLKNIFM